ncbi:aldo/keto reductase [candidate division WOR-3 bacterium]|nr:aldo/keto reductase [candidate division WOR-3 bacterium]
MRYVRFGKTGRDISVLGLGCMRFPVKGSYSEIDPHAAGEVLEKAVHEGINYFDTAYPYHGGNSEVFLGEFLGKELRKKVNLATKLPVWKVEKTEDFDSFILEQMKKLRTDFIDFYLLHSLSADTWKKMKELGIPEKAFEAKKCGKIGFVGFSFHDSYDVFREIINYRDDWDFCQIQYNFMNENFQAGTKGLNLAASKGIPVIIMEPLLGGNLACPPKKIEDVWQKAEVKRRYAEWALMWLWNKKEISLILSGMNTPEQVMQNSQTADISKPGCLSSEDMSLFEEVKNTYLSMKHFNCTGCSYCLPCPSGVFIPGILALYSDLLMFEAPENIKNRYRFIPEEKRADKCTGCKICETKCPQNLKISELIAEFEKIRPHDPLIDVPSSDVKKEEKND